MNKKGKYYDFSNVEKQRNYIIPEDLPDGPYGAPRGENTPVEGKSTPWGEEQRSYTYSNYENKSLHENMPRQYPGSHPTHDDPTTNAQRPYTDGSKE